MAASAWSTTSSRTTRRSSTSDEPLGESAAAAGPPATRALVARLAGSARLVHPFPSLLDGAVVAVVALVAGASVPVALRLGVSMSLLQFAIGALNDVVDAPRDAGRKPGKPIPAGLVSVAAARGVVVSAAIGGVGLALPGGVVLVGLAAVVLGIGAAYDLRAKGTALSWLPFALGIPLLPVYGWLGTTGGLPGVFLVLVPAAAVAGAALAVANAVVDVERDRAAGGDSVAIRLGPGWASAVVVVVQLGVAVLAVGTAAAAGAPAGWVGAVLLGGAVPAGGAFLGLVAAHGLPAWREVAWEVQAIGTGLLAVAWLAALSAAGRL
jgi:4-hydroxybenzoate polyprenyltransferase